MGDDRDRAVFVLCASNSTVTDVDTNNNKKIRSKIHPLVSIISLFAVLSSAFLVRMCGFLLALLESFFSSHLIGEAYETVMCKKTTNNILSRS